MTRKENIQFILDEMVKKYKEEKRVDVYLGCPVEEFTRDEMLALVRELGEEITLLRRN